MPPSSQAAMTVLASQFNTTLQRAIRNQRNYVETLGQQTIRDGHVHGFIDLATAGEIVVTAEFPISFLERPLFTCGLELAANIPLVIGNFPLWSATIANWTTQRIADTTLYVGATIGIVIFDAPRSVFHYSFEGQSFTAPTDATVGSPI